MSKVQPRVCGEYAKDTGISSNDIGSTPRMRGIFFAIRIMTVVIRFNPAYAGNII